MPKPKSKDPNNDNNPSVTETDFQSDLQTQIRKRARTKDERSATLTEALNRWAGEDIARLERVEDASRWGWAMWEYTD